MHLENNAFVFFNRVCLFLFLDIITKKSKELNQLNYKMFNATAAATLLQPPTTMIASSSSSASNSMSSVYQTNGHGLVLNNGNSTIVTPQVPTTTAQPSGSGLFNNSLSKFKKKSICCD